MDSSETETRKLIVTKNKSSNLVKEATQYREELGRRGVVYLARIPPLMKPNKIRNIFEDFGTVTRLYLAEEDAETRRKRKEAGGNGSKLFKEGWLEFSDKKIAKRVAESLNNTPIGGKKSNIYHDDIWNIKYLKNFKWDYLTEKFAYERRIREKKQALAMQQEKKVNAEFADLVEQSSIKNHIEDRKRKREGDDSQASNSNDKPERKIRQRLVLSSQHGEGEARIFDSSLIKNVFGVKSKMQ